MDATMVEIIFLISEGRYNQGKICYRTPLFCVVCRNTLLNCVFARTHRIAKNGKFGTFSSKLVISNKSAKLSIFGTVVCSDKCVTKL
jgi:hypothetical protein